VGTCSSFSRENLALSGNDYPVHEPTKISNDGKIWATSNPESKFNADERFIQNLWLPND
jgi:hypothetical protein